MRTIGLVLDNSNPYRKLEAAWAGNTYDAHISGLTSYGIYAQIDENHCEGMIPIRDLGNDYYDFDEKNFVIVGRRHHTKYQLGDPIRIQVARANVERKQLDFTLAE